MAKPTAQQRQVHRQFLRREKTYENKYKRVFLSILAKQYRQAGKQYPTPYVVNPDDYKQAIINLYVYIMPIEAEIAWDYYVVPLTSEQKDFFDDIASLLGFDIPRGEHIRLWRQISNQWLEVNILSKIRGIANTTQRHIAKIIERGIADGLSEREIGKAISSEALGEYNQYRGRIIARTESIMAMNKGRRIAMFSSNLLWDKKWLDTLDERTRNSHRKVAYGDWIPLDQEYILEIIKGGAVIGYEKADTPGDPRLSAGNVINCRCCDMFQVQRDAAGRPRRKTGTPLKIQELAEMI